MIVLVQPRRIAAVACAALGLASLALLWDAATAAAAIDSLVLPLAVVGAVGLVPYLGAGRGGPRSRIARLLAHIGILALAASITLGVIWGIAAVRTETLPWWTAIALLAIAIILVVDERWPLRGRLGVGSTESPSSP